MVHFVGTLTLLSASFMACFAQYCGDSHPCAAIAVLTEGRLRGNVTFYQKDSRSPVTVSGIVQGLSPGLHGFHIHQSGDLGNGCKNAGPHYNPHNQQHGAPTDQNRHVGDLGNIEADRLGIAVFMFDDPVLSVNYIINRAVVVHEKEDDLGRTAHPDSKKTGNAGGRLGCGVIYSV